MEQSLIILGRQPALGIAELESLYGAEKVRPAGPTAAVVGLPASKVDFGRLGGAVKLCKLLTILDTTNWGELERYLIKAAPEHASQLPEGKLTIGLSAYGIDITAARINATGLSIKKAIRKHTERPVRLVPNNEPTLSSAQTYHNHLAGERAWELVLIADGAQTILAQVTAVQDIDSYTVRDRERPKRDSRVGMLPPKLAQIIINLATSTSTGIGQIVLDPFCGTGVILQEAALMSYEPYGTDLEPRMVDYSGDNLMWLEQHFSLSVPNWHVQAGDATTYQWEPKPNAIATETYLGRPFTSAPDRELLAQTVTECNTIIKKFLKNIHAQLPSGTRLCVAVPAWQTRAGEFRHLPLIDQISDMGYNRMEFEHVKSEDLLYYREDQIVARELLIITRK